MRLIIAAALTLTASVALADEAPSTTVVAPDVAAVAATGQTATEGRSALTVAPSKSKSAPDYGGYEGCHGSRKASAKLIM